MIQLNSSRIFEPEIIINPDIRTITVPDELYNIGVVSDNNAEMVNIRIPRFFDDCDFSTKDCTISYNNALKERGVYIVRGMEIENDSLLLHWYISNHVTKKSGKIYFVVEFKKNIDERGMPYFWSTLPAELNVMASLDDNIVITENDNSLYRSLLLSLQATDKRVAELMQKVGQMTNSEFDSLKIELDKLKSTVQTLSENAAYINIGHITDNRINDLFS